MEISAPGGHRATAHPLSEFAPAAAGPVGTYRPDIDGLRAIAVAAVVMFHASPGLVTGGFVGVDIFFVISGYLITLLLDRDISCGSYSILTFYERRIRRLLPALATVLTITLLLASSVLLPAEFLQLNISSLATLAFASNIFFWSQTGYFAPNAEALPLLHTWSLAVEEQFYIVFPLLMYWLHKYLRDYRFLILAFATVLSFAFCLWGTFYKPGATFYLAPLRAWELLAGALVALGGCNFSSSRVQTELLGIVGLALIVSTLIFVHSHTPFPAIGALPAVMGSAAVIWAGNTQQTTVARLLCTRPLVALGLISYPLYLWHWPILVLSRQVFESIDAAALCLIVVVCILLSALTTWLVETPIRRHRLFGTRPLLFSAAGTALLALTVFNVAMIVRDGFLWPVTRDVRDLVAANMRAVKDWGYPNDCMKNFKRSLSEESVVYCDIGNETERKILFWGDSLIEQLYPAIVDAHLRGEFSNRQIKFATSGGCQPTPGLERLAQGFHCQQFGNYILDGTVLTAHDTNIRNPDHPP